jgi:hypothetical protein
MSQLIKQNASVSADESPRGPWADVEIVPPSEWLRRLEQALETKDHPARSLLSLWQGAYATPQEMVGLTFGNENSQAVSETLRNVRPLDGDDVMRMWRWIDQKKE